MSVLVTGLLGSPLPDCPVLGMSFMNESFFQNHSVLSREIFKCYCEWTLPGKHTKIWINGCAPSNLVYPEGAGSRKFQVLFLLSSRLTAIEISNCLAPSLKQAAPPHAPRYLLFCQTLGYPGRR